MATKLVSYSDDDYQSDECERPFDFFSLEPEEEEEEEQEEEEEEDEEEDDDEEEEEERY